MMWGICSIESATVKSILTGTEEMEADSPQVTEHMCNFKLIQNAKK
jgi:hypothetical protein